MFVEVHCSCLMSAGPHQLQLIQIGPQCPALWPPCSEIFDDIAIRPRSCACSRCSRPRIKKQFIKKNTTLVHPPNGFKAPYIFINCENDMCKHMCIHIVLKLLTTYQGRQWWWQNCPWFFRDCGLPISETVKQTPFESLAFFRALPSLESTEPLRLSIITWVFLLNTWNQTILAASEGFLKIYCLYLASKVAS